MARTGWTSAAARGPGASATGPCFPMCTNLIEGGGQSPMEGSRIRILGNYRILGLDLPHLQISLRISFIILIFESIYFSKQVVHKNEELKKTKPKP